MECANCGVGRIEKGKTCNKCGIGYEEMIAGIRHDEMKELIVKMEGLMRNHESIEIEASLLACELLNARFLVPVNVENDHLSVGTVKNHKGKTFIMIFTDREEYDVMNIGCDPATNPFDICLDLLDDGIDGFVINAKNLACELSMGFLENYFGDHIRKS